MEGRILAAFEKAVSIFQQSGINVNDKQVLKSAGATEQLLKTLEIYNQNL